MARFNAQEADNYGGQGGGGFFAISEDKGVKRVRFLYNNENDVEGYSVHKVKVGDNKERYVNCLRSYKDPVDDCPFCRERIKLEAKLFIPLYNVDEDQIQIWDRGKKMFEKMSALCSRYAKRDNLVQHIFEVERHGKPKDTGTTYEIFEVEKDDTQLGDFEDIPVIVGGLVLDKSYEDMEYYLESNEFPPEDDEETPKRRSSTRNSRQEELPKRRSSRQKEEEDTYEDIPEELEEELPFSNGKDEEEEEKPVRRSERKPERRTPNRRGEKF